MEPGAYLPLVGRRRTRRSCGTIVLLLDGVWWAILFIPFAAWQFWMMKKAVDRRNF